MLQIEELLLHGWTAQDGEAELVLQKYLIQIGFLLKGFKSETKKVPVGFSHLNWMSQDAERYQQQDFVGSVALKLQDWTF